VRLHRPWQSVGGTIVYITPADAGWAWTGIRVLRLAPGVPRTVHTGGSEMFVLPLSGGPLTVDVADEDGGPLESFGLRGRDSVFGSVTDFCYAGRGSVVALTSPRGGEVALPSSRSRSAAPAARPGRSPTSASPAPGTTPRNSSAAN
jgi:5-deoxy-glucuronate isomerase